VLVASRALVLWKSCSIIHGLLPVFESHGDEGSSIDRKFPANKTIGSILLEGILKPRVILEPSILKGPPFGNFVLLERSRLVGAYRADFP